MPTNKRLNTRGFALTELLASLPASFIILGTSAILFGNLTKKTLNLKSTFSDESSLTQATEHLLKTGKLSSFCIKVPGNPTRDLLECGVAYGNIPTFSNVRFRTDGEALYMDSRSGTSDTEAWETKLTYPGIQTLILCNQNDMDPDSPSCSIPSSSGSNFLGVSEKLFRFALGNGDGTSRIQGAFFVRNNPLLSATTFLWGTRMGL